MMAGVGSVIWMAVRLSAIAGAMEAKWQPSAFPIDDYIDGRPAGFTDDMDSVYFFRYAHKGDYVYRYRVRMKFEVGEGGKVIIKPTLGRDYRQTEYPSEQVALDGVASATERILGKASGDKRSYVGGIGVDSYNNMGKGWLRDKGGDDSEGLVKVWPVNHNDPRTGKLLASASGSIVI